MEASEPADAPGLEPAPTPGLEPGSVPASPSAPAPGLRPPSARLAFLLRFAERHPYITFGLLVVLSNVVGSYFNITYNRYLIVEHYLPPRLQQAFWETMVPIYNCAAYGFCITVIVMILRPLARARRKLRAGEEVPRRELSAARRLLINLPVYQVGLSLLGWLPGTVVFPAWLTLLSPDPLPGWLWVQFGVSFATSALLTTMQTFFLLELFVAEVFYPDFFKDARPADVRGGLKLSMGQRVMLLWCCISLMPVLALLMVVLNLGGGGEHEAKEILRLSLGVSIIGLPISAFLLWLMGGSLLAWLRQHEAATSAVTAGDYAARVTQKRPDELGRLSDRFNDMVVALEEGRRVRHTFGQFVSPDLRDELLRNDPGLGGEVKEITVLFADIRGFTRRSSGEPPEEAVALLNAFLSLSVGVVEGRGGWVNKFLGDGFMALFGAPIQRADHADLAMRAARDLFSGLEDLNRRLASEGRAPLKVGVGIHTGPALVGCVGASLKGRRGEAIVRREFTAIGDTVNLSQRLEQLTKTHGGPAILSHETVTRLSAASGLESLGPLPVPGLEAPVHAYRLVLEG